MTYSVKEIFYTLQGEGGLAGTPAVFCRFSGCNLWSGREEDRAHAICQFCDTDFVGTHDPISGSGGRFSTAKDLANRIHAQWPKNASLQAPRWVVFTGGEPLLQLDRALIDALHAQQFRIAVETNGSILAPDGIDWLCVSPKAGAHWVQKTGHDLKVVWPQNGLNLDACVEEGHFLNRFLQPLDPQKIPQSFKNQFIQIHTEMPTASSTLQTCIEHCLKDPRWRLSLQTHKIVGLR